LIYQVSKEEGVANVNDCNPTHGVKGPFYFSRSSLVRRVLQLRLTDLLNLLQLTLLFISGKYRHAGRQNKQQGNG